MKPAFDPFALVAGGPFEDLERYKQDCLDFSVEDWRGAVLKLGPRSFESGGESSPNKQQKQQQQLQPNVIAIESEPRAWRALYPNHDRVRSFEVAVVWSLWWEQRQWLWY